MNDQPRSDTGQFTAAEPLLTGNEGVLADAGYVPMDEPQDHPEAESDLKTEAARLAASRAPADPIVEVQYQRLDTGEKAPENETVSLDRAATDLGNWHAQQDEERARSVSSDFAKEIDKLRADAIKNPKAVEELGLDAEAIAAAKQAAQEAKAEARAEEPIQAKEVETRTDTPEADAFDSIEGLEPELKEVLKKSPQARAFLEQNATEAEQTKQAYSTALQQGQQVARATIAALAPQLDRIPLEQWPAAIQAIAQADPVRGKLVADTLSNWSQIQERQQLVAYHEQAQNQQHFERYVKSEDVRTEQLAKAEGLAVDYDKIVGYWEQQGLNRNQIMQLYKSNPVATSAEARLLVLKAARYDEMMKAPKPRPTRDLPPVAKPGTSSVHRSSGDPSSQIAALQKQIPNLTGDKAARAAAKLMQLQRKA